MSSTEKNTVIETAPEKNQDDPALLGRCIRTYDLGITTVNVYLGLDLKVALFDTVKQKRIRTIPKKGIDPDLQKKTADNLATLRASLKHTIKTESDNLLHLFLKGYEMSPDQWKKSYCDNPVRSVLASLIVWQQGEMTFIQDLLGLRNSNGEEYILNNQPVKVAHPIEMTAEDRISWQRWFNKRQLKQPFEQIWEPAYNPEMISSDRYKDYVIPFKYLAYREKHGISSSISGNPYWGVSLMLKLEDCEIDWDRPQNYYMDLSNLISTEEIIITEFTFKKFTRQVNHIVYLLDKLVIHQKIMNDDQTVQSMIPSLTFAQVSKYITLAREENAVNVLAMLLDGSNRYFADFDPMEEFTM